MCKNNLILFWSSYNKDKDTNYDEWLKRKIRLSPFHILSLLSYNKFQYRILLYSYQRISDDLPSNVEIKDASKIFSSSGAYNALLRGHSIAHISDAVRLYVASDIGGVVLDIDAVMVKPFPEVNGFFSSMPAKLTGGFAPKWGKSHPPLYISNKRWDGKALSAFPVKVSKAMKPYIRKLSFKIMHNLIKVPEKSTKGWNYIMWALKALALKDKESPVFSPIRNCPLPAWMPSGKCYSLEEPTRLNGKTILFGYRLPSVSEIFDKSYIIQHFFESAFQKAVGVDNNFWNTISDKCLVGQEADYILGNNWRSVLSES